MFIYSCKMCSNLADADLKTVRSFFDLAKHFLCDNDGVLSICGETLPTAKNFYETLKKLNFTVNILTNNVLFDKEYLMNKLNNAGFIIRHEDIINHCMVATNYLKKRNFQGKILVVGHEVAVKYFSDAGFTVSDMQPEFKNDLEMEVLKLMIVTDPEIKAVFFDVHLFMTYHFVARIINHLQDPNVLLLFGATDESLPMGQNRFVIGPSGFQKLVIEATGREPIVLGKPGEEFGKYITDVLKYKASETILIGDSLDQDISIAKKLGFKSIVTLSGNTNLEQLKNCHPDQMADFYVENIQVLTTILQNAYKL